MIFIVDIALQYRWNSVVEHSVSVWVVIAFIVVRHGLYLCLGLCSIQLSPRGCTHLSLLIQSIFSSLSLFSIRHLG